MALLWCKRLRRLEKIPLLLAPTHSFCSHTFSAYPRPQAVAAEIRSQVAAERSHALEAAGNLRDAASRVAKREEERARAEAPPPRRYGSSTCPRHIHDTRPSRRLGRPHDCCSS